MRHKLCIHFVLVYPIPECFDKLGPVILVIEIICMLQTSTAIGIRCPGITLTLCFSNCMMSSRPVSIQYASTAHPDHSTLEAAGINSLLNRSDFPNLASIAFASSLLALLRQQHLRVPHRPKPFLNIGFQRRAGYNWKWRLLAIINLVKGKSKRRNMGRPLLLRSPLYTN